MRFTNDVLGFEKNEKQDFFFNHDYFFSDVTSEETFAYCEWVSPFSVGLKKYNTYAVQFHPEKSQKAGKKFLSQLVKKYDV